MGIITLYVALIFYIPKGDFFSSFAHYFALAFVLRKYLAHPSNCIGPYILHFKTFNLL